MSETQRYTHEVLAEAAARCADIEEVAAFLGTRPYSRLPAYLLKRFAHFGIDVSHFPCRVRRGAIPRPTRKELLSAVAESTSIASALRNLHVPDRTRTRALFRRWIAEDGIDTSHFLGQRHGRGKQSAQKKPAQEVLVKRESGRRTKTVVLRRALREIGVPEECAECGTGPQWLGNPMTLEIDHVNGDALDDRPTNLRLLCPNCHAITSTWCRGGRPRSRVHAPARSATAPATMVGG
nr:HNH endonuclease signature motif containing protein [Streptomyces sp. RPT161]